MSTPSIPADSYLRPNRILIIGGGPAGLTTLHNLTTLGSFDRVELVERRDNIGGVWYLDPPDQSHGTAHRHRWPSPAYKGMIGNVLPTNLSFHSFPFPQRPDPHQPFPTLSETHEYLLAFAAPYLSSGAIRFNTEVLRVEEQKEGWKVVLRDVARDEVKEERWDAVVGAVGWYDNPVWPDTPGLDVLRERGVARHAKVWTGPEGYEGKRVLVVANANSSNDIAAQLAPIAQSPIYQSIRRPAFPGFPSLPDERIEMVSPVQEYIFHDSSGKVEAKLSDGRSIPDIDYVILGTGYKVFPDFIHILNTESQLNPLITPTTYPNRIPHLHNLILYAHNPTLAFTGAPMAFTPFTIFDLQATWLALCWTRTNPIMYPETTEGRLKYDEDRIRTVEEWRSGIDNPSALMVYNVLGMGEEDYASMLRAEVVAVRPELGQVLPVWSEESVKARDRMFVAKLDALRWARDELGEGEASG
ncbi:hypothetical protein BDQ17DRAFT_1372812 [Cyathus striatus]|nr:hypothetical protein BDQ17DRAFT_1372812 [Cyathus striatus]